MGNPVTPTELPPVPHRFRDGWLDLCGEWEFGYDARPDGGAGFDRTITVPYPPESELSGIAERGFHPVVWYRRGVELTRRDERRVVLLTDTLQETNGLLTEYRESKLDLQKVHEIVTQPAAAIPSEAVDVFRRKAQRQARR